MEIVNQGIMGGGRAPISITPSGFFGDSIDNIVELENFITEEEQQRLINFALTNKIWDKTETHIDEDGLVLYDANIWEDRVCTAGSLKKSDPGIIDLLWDMIDRLKVEVDKFFNVNVQATGPAIVRWPVGARQEPHADKEFHTGEEEGRPNDFPYYDIAGLFYFDDDYEGGELYFPTHGVRPVKSGNRFTAPFFWTIVNHTGEKQPPENYSDQFKSPSWQKLYGDRG